MDSDIIKALKRFGFTQQESIMYVTLCRNGALTGYEAAKLAGISRSNAYAALSSLVEKGGAVASSDDTSKYVPTPRKELLVSIRRHCDETLEYLDQHLPEEQPVETPYLTVSGYQNTMDKIRNMLQLAQLRVYISMHADNAASFRQDMIDCVQRGLKVVILSNTDPDVPGAIFMQNSAGSGHIKLIADTREVITGIVEQAKRTGQCLYSANEHLVYLMREALLNEIELIKIRSGVGGTEPMESVAE
ncbi:TrmB family transcriptional regulator [Oleidesulfovibrio sp.]|uniref:TrmB family transcriptional regulator n=1 Tax=Oleidesulfovibrio sp. TaxID=2909707 RepID=UPI003A86EB50